MQLRLQLRAEHLSGIQKTFGPIPSTEESNTDGKTGGQTDQQSNEGRRQKKELEIYYLFSKYTTS